MAAVLAEVLVVATGGGVVRMVVGSVRTAVVSSGIADVEKEVPALSIGTIGSDPVKTCFEANMPSRPAAKACHTYRNNQTQPKTAVTHFSFSVQRKKADGAKAFIYFPPALRTNMHVFLPLF